MVVALVKVEVTLLLRDALDPEASILLSWHSNGKSENNDPQPSSSAVEVWHSLERVFGLY